MKQTFRKLGLTASFVTVLASCDGGSSGTGINTSALGNVASINTASRPSLDRVKPTTMIAQLFGSLGFEQEALARGALEDIRVTIEGTTLSTQTDGQGQFVLRGNFAGPVAMLFDLPDGGRASLTIVVPRGGNLTLANVHLDGRTGTATVDSQRVRFEGLVDGADCAQDAATMVSSQTPNDGNRYTVLLGSATLQDPSGNPLACGHLSAGQSANVDGQVQDNGAVQAQSVEVQHEPTGQISGGGGDGGGGTSGSGRGNGGSNGGEGGGGSGPSGDGSSGDGRIGGSSDEGGGSSPSSGEGEGHD